MFKLGVMGTLQELEVENSGCLEDSLFCELIRTNGVRVSIVIYAR